MRSSSEPWSLRLTWQINTKNKLNLQGQNGQQKRPYYGYACCNAFTTSPEATFYSQSRPMYLVQSSWNSPITSRLLLEASAGGASKNFETYLQPGMSPSQPSWTDLSTGVIWGNYQGVYGANANFQFNTRLAASYVTGSHAARFGITFMHSNSHVTQSVVNNAMTYQLLGSTGPNGVISGTPSRVTVFSTPLTLDAVMKANMGIFAQDQWTIRRLTLNLGVRFDYFNAYVPAQHISEGPNVPTRSVDFAQVNDVPNWKSTSPRLGAAYDLFGTGKTAVKASLGRYMEAPNLTTITRVMDPAAAIVNSATRTWNDANRDFVPQPGELGPITNVNFGSSVITQAYADDVRTTRGYNWEGSASIQHELMRNVSLNLAYYRRWFGNLTVTQNTRVTSADFSTYCVAVPVNARLPGGGGGQLCGLYDVNLNKFGQSFNLIQEAEDFGSQQDVFDGVDVVMNARLTRGVIVQGGFSRGRERTNNCYAMNDLSLVSFNTGNNFTAGTPRRTEYCDVRPPFLSNVKALMVLPLPWGLQTSATYQGLPGPQILANAAIRNADIAPSLGRSLSSCPATGACNATVAVSLIAPGTVYGDRLDQVDFRLTKAFKLPQGRRVQGMVDLYNLLNGAAVITQNNTFGSAWLRPTQILQARLVKFGVQFDF